MSPFQFGDFVTIQVPDLSFSKILISELNGVSYNKITLGLIGMSGING